MKLFVKDEGTGDKVYLKNIAKDREDLAKNIGSSKLKVKDKIYSVNSVQAESGSSLAYTTAMGGVVGVLFGIAGIAIGATIGAIVGVKSDEEEKNKVENFNKSKK
ncbi:MULTISPECIES: hypothetical protein [unclassified Serratia (in: enterobacteria)]|uniref:hypothetical protein n=1 Tax=unclassified Serratia (in: enterobacteria) TaxID=2647522 RepID=UPI000587F4A0|nr:MULTISPECIES: hypothetical protein [unclassified Serratia (in: enterobacteria)]UAN51631.1 hypothetical protein KGP26_00590 [Serratia sp. JSRIV002]UAN57636.1 hypothetical protein KGP21_00590 [Serratia sp. JSRIV004]